MEKLPMCRICLAENVPFHVVVNRNLHELYEKLTDIPFITEDSRPILACFFCCAKLKQCYRLLTKCLEAEELFAQMMNEDYEPSPLLNKNHLEVSGFIKSPIVHISINDECQTESIAIKEELPAVCEALDDIIEPKEKHQSDELEPESLHNSCLDAADVLPHNSESDLEDDELLMKLNTEVEVEQEVSMKKRRARETKRTAVAKKPKLDTPRRKQEDAIIAEQTKKDKSDSNLIRTTQKRTSKPGSYFKEPYKFDQRSFNRVKEIIKHTRSQIGEKPYKCDVCQRGFSVKSHLTNHISIHTGEKPYKCDICERSYKSKSTLTGHIRTHTSENPFKCDECQQIFGHKSNLTKHICQHTGKKPNYCDLCERNFSNRINFTQHIKELHPGENFYKCDECENSFGCKSSLTRHKRLHTGEKPYKCDVSQRSFSEKSAITKHVRSHTGEIIVCYTRDERDLFRHKMVIMAPLVRVPT